MHYACVPVSPFVSSCTRVHVSAFNVLHTEHEFIRMHRQPRRITLAKYETSTYLLSSTCSYNSFAVQMRSAVFHLRQFIFRTRLCLCRIIVGAMDLCFHQFHSLFPNCVHFIRRRRLFLALCSFRFHFRWFDSSSGELTHSVVGKYFYELMVLSVLLCFQVHRNNYVNTK